MPSGGASCGGVEVSNDTAVEAFAMDSNLTYASNRLGSKGLGDI